MEERGGGNGYLVEFPAPLVDSSWSPAQKTNGHARVCGLSSRQILKKDQLSTRTAGAAIEDLTSLPVDAEEAS